MPKDHLTAIHSVNCVSFIRAKYLPCSISHFFHYAPVESTSDLVNLGKAWVVFYKPATNLSGFAIYFVNIQGFFFICLPFQFFSIPESIKVALVQLHQTH